MEKADANPHRVRKSWNTAAPTEISMIMQVIFTVSTRADLIPFQLRFFLMAAITTAPRQPTAAASVAVAMPR